MCSLSLLIVIVFEIAGAAGPGDDLRNSARRGVRRGPVENGAP